MIRYKDVYIPKPCDKIHYESLPFHPIQRDCSLCQEQVYDFRGKTEEYFNTILTEQKGNFCAVFHKDQIREKPAFAFAGFFNAFQKYSLAIYLLVAGQISKAQNNTSSEIKTEQIPASPSSEDKGILFHTQECKSCLDEYYIDISINNVRYGTFKINDSTTIYFPSTIKPTDAITIQEYRSKRPRGFKRIVTKQGQQSFEFGNNDEVTIKRSRHIRYSLIFKRRIMIMGKFR